VRQQIVISGLGGQGVLFLTRILAEAALEEGLDVLTSETHGMAMRGGSVISQVKVGGFLSPLIADGGADAGLFLEKRNLPVHRRYLRPDGFLVVDTRGPGDHHIMDASGTAGRLGSPVAANLVLLGYAVRHGSLFCSREVAEGVIGRISRDPFREMNLEAFRAGLSHERNSGSSGGGS